MQILPGIHQVERVSGANVYLLADQALTLIDAGLPDNAEPILSYIRKIGRHPEELSQIIITHNHVDHVGSAAELQALTKAKVLAHPADAELTAEANAILMPKVRGRSRFLKRWLPRSPARVNQFVNDGDIVSCLGKLRIVHTPGHTPGSICAFLVESKVLFSGDTILNNRDRLSRPIPHPGSDVAQFEQSLRKLAELDIEACFFSHGEPLLDNASGRVRQFVAQPPSTPVLRVMKNLRRVVAFHLHLMRRRR